MALISSLMKAALSTSYYVNKLIKPPRSISSFIRTCQTSSKSTNEPITAASSSSDSSDNSLTTTKESSDSVKEKLMEFFDDKKNWDKSYIKHGRAWKTDELRIKSNSDLHKLWFVLLKERNMLFTMEYACEKSVEFFASSERIDKVEESMTNLETVVRERNEAYYHLETGATGERPIKSIVNAFGDHVRYRASEHYIPEKLNSSYKRKYLRYPMDRYAYVYQRLMHEKRSKELQKYRNRQKNHVFKLLKRVKNVDDEAIQEQFPDAKLEAIKKKVGNHYYDNWENRQT